jgi:hypothetical protein
MPQGRHPRQTARVDEVTVRGEKVDVQLDVPDLRGGWVEGRMGKERGVGMGIQR